MTAERVSLGEGLELHVGMEREDHKENSLGYVQRGRERIKSDIS